MRYEKVEYLLRLALDMQNSFGGISIQDIQDEYEVSRRTAIRMRDMIGRIFPLEEVKNYSSRVKKWRLTKTPLAAFFLPFFSSEGDVYDQENLYS